jgi:hypothetical protein
MATTNNFTTRPLHGAPAGKRMLQGAAIAFIVIALFLLPIKHTNPAWGNFWMVRPFIIVPIAGAMGGLFYYLMDHLRYQGGWKMALATFISLFAYIVALWLGSILGLAGTLWN